MPLENQDFNWALFRISWNDNWQSWEWSADARLKGNITSYSIASIIILEHLWGKWGIELNSKSNVSYQVFMKILQSNVKI